MYAKSWLWRSSSVSNSNALIRYRFATLKHSFFGLSFPVIKGYLSLPVKMSPACLLLCWGRRAVPGTILRAGVPILKGLGPVWEALKVSGLKVVRVFIF